MIWSNERKLSLSGWLQKNDYSSFDTPLKLQKFLFFYESSAKVEADNYDFAKLKGYKNGPVFSQVWGDYTKERQGFEEKSRTAYEEDPSIVNEPRAKIIDFFIRVSSPVELSEVTHHMDIWSKKKDRIDRDEKQVELDSDDFSKHDADIIETIREAFPISYVETHKVLPVGNKSFVMSNEDAVRLTPEQSATLQALSQEPELDNPVYVHLDANGGIIVD
ncbi:MULTISPECIES: hypothetical protein [Lacticaseibacillus]|jgi:hypothetical protein|nr:hypothetical protein [Lacticaseibacillus casei]MBI6598225.1 hypothetical protein [Lacticaseibacillus casei]MBO1481991.1 hypothetical protein [Lacticaseibacillus casei]MBO2417789.1 hypothetical protein [Lacticaseibacillus casei]MCK2081679.1 hypothetical protein [Lacticaseibacillus casei]MED7631888.1 hypothetical protein [Lacticaseibacillus casei]